MQPDAQLQFFVGHVRYDVLLDRLEKFQSKKRHLVSMALVDSRETAHDHVRIADCLHFVHDENEGFVSTL